MIFFKIELERLNKKGSQQLIIACKNFCRMQTKECNTLKRNQQQIIVFIISTVIFIGKQERQYKEIFVTFLILNQKTINSILI